MRGLGLRVLLCARRAAAVEKEVMEWEIRRLAAVSGAWKKPDSFRQGRNLADGAGISARSLDSG